MKYLSAAKLEEIYNAFVEHNDYFEKHGKVKEFPYNEQIREQYHIQMQQRMEIRSLVFDNIKNKN